MKEKLAHRNHIDRAGFSALVQSMSRAVIDFKLRLRSSYVVERDYKSPLWGSSFIYYNTVYCGVYIIIYIIIYWYEGFSPWLSDDSFFLTSFGSLSLSLSFIYLLLLLLLKKEIKNNRR